MLFDLPHWREVSRVCELALPVAVGRPACEKLDFGCLEGIASPERIEEMRCIQVEMPECGLSARDIRRRVAVGQSIRYRVPRAVEMYIETHELYRKSSD
jgi:nicotinate-nucleotide adenylyltransferase